MSPIFWLLCWALVSLSHTQGELLTNHGREYEILQRVAAAVSADVPVFEPLLSSGGVTFTIEERATEGSLNPQLLVKLC